jgi:putative nucleotidyltransferase with HDIG domain
MHKLRHRLAREFFGKTLHPVLLFVLIVLLALAVTALVYVSGGTKFVYVQMMYLPIVLCGLLFHARFGLLFGVLAGLMMGPLMPLEVANQTYQPTEAWLLRMVFFCINGTMAGAVADLLRHRIRLLEQIQRKISLTYGRTLRSLVVLIAERDNETADHCERVAYNAVKVGEAMGLTTERLEVLYWAALLHDLGKIGISESILGKPSSLSAAERLEMQRHVEIGCRVILHASHEFAPIAEVVAAHHERLDGMGYPNRLSGGAIPLEARILAVVDVFEALTSWRPYHAAQDQKSALAQVRSESGKHFDPQVVDVFTALLGRGQLVGETNMHLLESVKDRYHGDGLFMAELRLAA